MTYYDRYHTPLLVEKTGFNGETIFQESTTKFLFDAQGNYTGAQKLNTQPYFAHDPPPPYAIEEQDVYGRKTKVTSADGSQSVVFYAGLTSTSSTLRGGSAVANQNSRMRTHTRRVDQAERPLEIVDNVGSSVAFTYAADGQPLSATTSYVGNGSASTSASTTITTTYNAQRLKESVTDPNAGTSYTYYDSFGRAVLTRDALGKGTATSFDGLGRPLRTITGLSVTGNDYGPHEVTDWIAGLSTTLQGETETLYTYDTATGYGLGKVASVTFREFERNAGGFRTAQREVVETYTYDVLGRSVSVSTVLSGQVAFNGTYNVSTSYDGLGRVKTVTDAGGYTRASAYNAYGFLSAVHEFSAGGAMLWRGMSYDAAGKMLLEYNGNGIGTQNRYHPTRGFLESSRTLRWAALNAAVQEYEMQLDDLGNVLWRREQRFEAASPVTRTETFGYDSINRLTYSSVTGQSTQAFTFAANGNIQTKSGIGSYAYGERGHGPHAVTSVTLGTEVQRSYSYDAKGRMTTEHVGTNLGVLPLREIAYTSFDQPRFIQHWGAAALSSDVGALDDGTTPWDQICTLRFYFGPGMQRLIQTKHKGQLVTKVLSLGGFEIREVTNGASLTGTMIEREERSSFGNGTRVKRWTVTNPNTPVISYEFAAKDHLGSDTANFDGAGQLREQRGHLKAGEVQKTERQSYDAWGARRDGETWAPAEGQLGAGVANSGERIGSNLPRGYTGHEMLDDVGLIHMNGRLYDAALGRMCAADRDVQAPDMVQNYNRYSYVLNNPMNAVDPSGHNWFKKIIGIIIAVIIAVIIAIVAAYALGMLLQATGALLTGGGGLGTLAASSSAWILGGSTFLVNGSIWLGAAVGAAWSAVNTTIAGGSFSQVLKSSITGAANGAVGAIIGGGMHAFGDWAGSALAGGDSIIGTAAHLSAHGVAGGAMSEANGGSFRDGFIGGLVGAGVSGLAGKVFGGTSLYNPDSNSYGSVASIAGRTAIAAVAGGLSSMATGGKFADGAYSAAFFHLFNNEAGRWWATRNSTVTRIGALVDTKDDGEGGEYATGPHMRKMAEYLGARIISITDPTINGQDPTTREFKDWQTAMSESVKNFGKYDLLYISDHGTTGLQTFGNSALTKANWDFITSNLKPGGVVVLMGCNVAYGPIGASYLTSLAARAHATNGYSLTVVGYTGGMAHASLTATGNQVSTVYIGGGLYAHKTLSNFGN